MGLDVIEGGLSGGDYLGGESESVGGRKRAAFDENFSIAVFDAGANPRLAVKGEVHWRQNKAGTS